MLTWAVVTHCEICLLFNLSFYSNVSGSRIFLLSVCEYVCASVDYFLFHKQKKKVINSAVKLVWISQMILRSMHLYCKIFRNKISYGCIPMLTDQARSLQHSGLQSNEEHGTFFGPASCGENFVLVGGRPAVCGKMWKDFGTATASVGFMGWLSGWYKPELPDWLLGYLLETSFKVKACRRWCGFHEFCSCENKAKLIHKGLHNKVENSRYCFG